MTATPARRIAAALLLVGPVSTARAQAPAAEMPTASTPAKTTRHADLTNRYRFTERYGLDDEKLGPGLIGSYRVGIVEVARDTVDTPQGAPKQIEATRQTIFSERAAELGGLGNVAATVRAVERFRTRPEDPARTMGPRPLDGLSATVRPRAGGLPLVVSLAEGRRMTDYEFEATARQVFVPHLAALLPDQAVRLGDTWRVSRRGAQAMLGEPNLQGDTLVGKLVELRKEVDGPRMVAQLTITGKATGASGDPAVNAEVLFTFTPESSLKSFPAGRSFPPRPTEDVIEARGAVTELRLARLSTAEIPGPGRLRFRSNREVTLHRQIGLGASPAALPKLAAAPAATEANSWISYLEPSGRFSFLHPQDFLAPDRGPTAPPEPNVAVLVRVRREGTDMLQLEFSPKALAPEALKQKLAARYASMKAEVIPGTEEWLPEAEWPNQKVYRVESAVKLAESGSARIHFDGYLVLSGQSASLLAIATTNRAAVAAARRESEEILRSLQVAPGRALTD